MQRCHKSASFGSLILHQLTKRVFILNLFGTLCHTAHFSPSNKTAATKNSLFSLWCLIYKTPIGLPNFHSITLYSAQGEDQHLAHAAMTHKVHHVHAPATLRKIAPEYIWSFSVRARCKRGGCILALLFFLSIVHALHACSRKRTQDSRPLLWQHSPLLSKHLSFGLIFI